MNPQSYYSHCKDLYDKKLFKSCMSVLSLTLACITENKDDPILHLCLSLKAECCYQLGYLDRAIENYNQAISYLTSKSLYELPSIVLTSSNIGENSNTIKRKSILQEKIGTCWFELGVFEKSVIELEKIPEDYISFPARLTLFKACLNISSCKAYNYGLQLLRESPTALEIIDMLIDLDEANISDIIDFQLEPWVKSYIEFKYYSSRMKFSDSKKSLEIIQKSLPSNIKLYIEESNFYYRQGDFAKAIEIFEKVLKLDPMETEGISVYFNMLAFMERSDDIKNIVSKHSGNGIPKASHCLIGLARVWEFKKEKLTDALLLIQKAIDLNQFDIDAIIAKAQLLCKKGDFIESLKEFQLAFGMQKNFMIYEGFVLCAIKAKEFRLAKLVAANAIQNMPSNYRSLILMGLVYFFSPCDSLMVDKDNISIAQGYFDKAVLNSPGSPEPIIWKAAIERKNRNYQAAKTLLCNHLEKSPCALAYTQLGYIYCIMKDFINALEQFKKALSLQKNFRVAKSGRNLALEGLKKQQDDLNKMQHMNNSQMNPGEGADSNCAIENTDSLENFKIDPDSVMNPLLVPLYFQ